MIWVMRGTLVGGLVEEGHEMKFASSLTSGAKICFLVCSCVGLCPISQGEHLEGMRNPSNLVLRLMVEISGRDCASALAKRWIAVQLEWVATER